MPPDLASLRLMLADIQRTIDVQVSSAEALATRAARVIAWNGLLLGALMTAWSIVGARGDVRLGALPFGLTIMGLAGVIVSVSFAMRAYVANAMRPGLDPAHIVEALAFEYEEEFHLAEAIRALAQGYEDNSQGFAHSTRRFTQALVAFFAALIIVATAIAVFIWGGGRYV